MFPGKLAAIGKEMIDFPGNRSLHLRILYRSIETFTNSNLEFLSKGGQCHGKKNF